MLFVHSIESRNTQGQGRPEKEKKVCPSPLGTTLETYCTIILLQLHNGNIFIMHFDLKMTI